MAKTKKYINKKRKKTYKGNGPPQPTSEPRRSTRTRTQPVTYESEFINKPEATSRQTKRVTDRNMSNRNTRKKKVKSAQEEARKLKVAESRIILSLPLTKHGTPFQEQPSVLAAHTLPPRTIQKPITIVLKDDDDSQPIKEKKFDFSYFLLRDILNTLKYNIELDILSMEPDIIQNQSIICPDNFKLVKLKDTEYIKIVKTDNYILPDDKCYNKMLFYNKDPNSYHDIKNINLFLDVHYYNFIKDNLIKTYLKYPGFPTQFRDKFNEWKSKVINNYYEFNQIQILKTTLSSYININIKLSIKAKKRIINIYNTIANKLDWLNKALDIPQKNMLKTIIPGYEYLTVSEIQSYLQNQDLNNTESSMENVKPLNDYDIKYALGEFSHQ